MRVGRGVIAAAAVGSLLSPLVAQPAAAASDFEPVSSDPVQVEAMAGEQLPDGSSAGLLLSRDGRYAAWTTSATNWASADANGDQRDVLRRDLRTGDITLVDADSAGVQGDGDAVAVDMTPDGRYVLFHSSATNLVRHEDALSRMHLYRKDTVTGAIDLVDRDTAGALSHGGPFDRASMSADGRFIAFFAPRAFDEDGHGGGVYLRDTTTGTTTLANGRLDGTGVSFGFATSGVRVSDDGRYVTFDASLGTTAYDTSNLDLVPEGSPFRDWGSVLTAQDRTERNLAQKNGVYRKDMVTGEVRFLSVGDDGAPASAMHIWTQTRDGRYVFAMEGTWGSSHIVRTDTTTGERRNFDLRNSGDHLWMSGYPGPLRASDDGDRLLFVYSDSGTTVVRDDSAGVTYDVNVGRASGTGGAISGDGRLAGVVNLLSSGNSIWGFAVRALPTGDDAPPDVVGTADREANAHGWYDAPVTIDWTATDPEPSSGPASTPAPTTLAGDGRDQIATSAPSCDRAGNCGRGASGPVSIDQTLPAVAVGGVTDGSSYTLGAVPRATCTATDELSGLEGECSLDVSGGNANGVGTFTVVATARDLAGNRASRTVHYRVVYSFPGFRQPIDPTGVSVFRAGSTVPVTFGLTSADGTPISPVAVPRWMTPQRGGATTAPVDETTYPGPATTGELYELRDGRWQYNWKTPRDVGGYHWRIGVALDDGTTRYVTVGLR